MQKPDWLKIRPPTSDKFKLIKQELNKLNLHTVCQESHCPNQSECWSAGTATCLIMGDTCTRGCRFCNIKTAQTPALLDPDEPKHIIQIIKKLNLKYVVLTSVTRDDLPDRGAEHFAKCISAIKEYSKSSNKQILVEVLTPDYKEVELKTVLDADPDVFAHNIEVVERLTKSIRDNRFNYKSSLKTLGQAKQFKDVYTKSSLMVGLGETKEEVLQTLKDLRSANVDFLTIGQYLQPSNKHAQLVEYIAPEIFNVYKKEALKLGFKFVASGPFVRSSYKAHEFHG